MKRSENSPIKLSIVIAAWNGGDYLHRCLQSLEKQANNADTEVIAVSNLKPTENKKAFPFVNYIFAEEATVPKLRTEGIQATSGSIIALVEDHCTFEPEWCREIRKAHELPFKIVGGAVENESLDSGLNWAVYFYDYGNYMLPVLPGASETLSGMNVSYKREMLEEIRQIYEAGFFETFVNEELKNRGHKLYLAPSIIVYHNKNYNFKTVTSQFYHQARSFAHKRIINLPLSKRALFIIISLLLPMLLPARVILRIIKKKRHLIELISAFPYLIIMLTIWATGEFYGYLFGAGASDDKWR